MKKSDILFLLSLFRGAFHRSVRTIYTAIARVWAQNGFAVFAFIKKLAAIGGHFFGFLMTAIWAGYG